MSETFATCPNCGAPRTGRYCGACGQNDRSYLRATREIVGDVLSEVFDFDSRLGRTLKYLLLRPGFLSSEFASDRRARYVSPVRLYIVVSLVFFGVLSLTSRFESVGPAQQAIEPAEVASEMKADPELAKMYGQLNDAQRARLKSILEKQGMANDAVKRHIEELDEASRRAPSTPASKLESAISDRLLDLAENPRGAYQTVVSDLPAAMFFTLPLYAAWLKLLYRRRFYAEHIVFALHLHSFLFFIGTFILVLPDSSSQPAAGAMRVWTGLGAAVGDVLRLTGIAYYLVALKRFYLDTWTLTIAKFFAVNVAHAVLIALGVALVTTVALAFY
jgi:hypothetical protein